MISELLYLITILLGIPSGIILYYMCAEEIESWRKSLHLINLISIIGIILLYFIEFSYYIPIIVSLFFIQTTNFTILYKNHRKKHKKRK